MGWRRFIFVRGVEPPCPPPSGAEGGVDGEACAAYSATDFTGTELRVQALLRERVRGSVLAAQRVLELGLGRA